MYNGVGLSSVRGTGTSGYVQRNLSHVRAQQVVRRQEHARVASTAAAAALGAPRARNADILRHDAARRVELKLLELR